MQDGNRDAGELERELHREAYESRGPSDERLYATHSSTEEQMRAAGWTEAIGIEPYVADLDKLSPQARTILTAYRARQAKYRAAAEAKAKAALERTRLAIARLNRGMALHHVTPQLDGIHDHAGAEQWFTRCACGWHGLRVADPEVARREYDGHACTITGDAHIDRAIATVGHEQYATGRMIVTPLAPELQVDSLQPAASAPTTTAHAQGDDLEQRVQMLEPR